DDAGPHSGWNCGAPEFHRCLVPTLHPQTVGGTRAPDLARSDPTLLLFPVAHTPTLPSTPTLPLSPVPQCIKRRRSHSDRSQPAGTLAGWPTHHHLCAGPGLGDVTPEHQHDAGGPRDPAGLAKGQYRGPVPSGARSRVSAGPVTVQGHRPPGLSAGQLAARPQLPRGQETPPGDLARGQMDKNAQAMGPLPPRREAAAPGLQGGPAPGAGTGVAAIAEGR
ncbi:uncharacterized protein LOC144289968, partial [Canis aureus]